MLSPLFNTVRMLKQVNHYTLPPQAAKTRPFPGKAAGDAAPEAYPLGYVEDASEPRTKLEICFSILRLATIGRFGFEFQGMYSPILHRLIQRLINHAMTIQEVFPFKEIGYHSHRKMVHRAGSVGNRHVCIGQRPDNIGRQCIRRNHGCSTPHCVYHSVDIAANAIPKRLS
jgi:hypothetical protein